MRTIVMTLMAASLCAGAAQAEPVKTTFKCEITEAKGGGAIYRPGRRFRISLDGDRYWHEAARVMGTIDRSAYPEIVLRPPTAPGGAKAATSSSSIAHRLNLETATYTFEFKLLLNGEERISRSIGKCTEAAYFFPESLLSYDMQKAAEQALSKGKSRK